MKKQMTIQHEVSIDEKVAYLSEPSHYPFFTDTVQVKETHMSWVFLADGLVYKLKKPVKYDMFDHTSLESRYRNSKEEIMINKFLAREIYIGIVPLLLDDKEQLQLNGEGETIDWLVKMKRIPEDNLLDHAIEKGMVNQEYLRLTAALLVDFYKQSEPVSIHANKFIAKQEHDINCCLSSLSNSLFGHSPFLLDELKAGLIAFLSANRSLFVDRIKSNKVIDAHGDLRPEHICLAAEPAIIDRLEFCRELRIMDIAEELAYLSMECEVIGDKAPALVFKEAYEKESGDMIPEGLSLFYQVKKACLRSWLVARHIEEDQYKKDLKWFNKSKQYMALAEQYFQQLGS
jgi:aminoglycoside phosphotransferase family enzyme